MNDMTVDVLSADGKKAGTAQLPADVFAVATNVPLIHQVVVAQQAAARQGTHSTKTRGEVSGGGVKPWRQKGTGRARQGSRRAPQWAGGGIVHGPKPRDYAQRTPKKMIQAAVRGALSDRAREGLIFVLDAFVTGAQPSTRQASQRLDALGEFRRVLVVLDRADELSWLSLRNLAGVHVLAWDQLNAYDVVNCDAVVFTKDALDAFVAGPAKGKPAKAVATSSEALAEDAVGAVEALAQDAAGAGAKAEVVEAADDAADQIGDAKVEHTKDSSEQVKPEQAGAKAEQAKAEEAKAEQAGTTAAATKAQQASATAKTVGTKPAKKPAAKNEAEEAGK